MVLTRQMKQAGSEEPTKHEHEPMVEDVQPLFVKPAGSPSTNQGAEEQTGGFRAPLRILFTHSQHVDSLRVSAGKVYADPRFIPTFMVRRSGRQDIRARAITSSNRLGTVMAAYSEQHHIGGALALQKWTWWCSLFWCSACTLDMALNPHGRFEAQTLTRVDGAIVDPFART